MLIPLILTVLWSLIVSFMCSVSEAVVLSVTHAQVEALGRTRGAEILREFKREIDLPIAAIVSFHTVAHTVGASVCGAMYVSVFGEKTLWVFSLVFTIAVLIFSEIIPKTIGVTYAQQLAVPVAYSVRALVVVLKPLLWLTSLFARLLRGDHVHIERRRRPGPDGRAALDERRAHRRVTADLAIEHRQLGAPSAAGSSWGRQHPA